MRSFFPALIAICTVSHPQNADAGVFNIPHFVPQDRFSLGLEPELRLGSGSGLGGNLKYTQGINELTNMTGIVGTGNGSHGFRIGANVSFDLFPDAERQPGIGIAAQALYYRLNSSAGDLELTGIPYLHKTFPNNGSEIEPFVALPIGWQFAYGAYTGITTLSVGAFFKQSEHFSLVAELGIPIANAQTYFSGGVIYYY